MRNFLSDVFYFNKRERRGIYLLFALICLVCIFNILLPYFFQKPVIQFDKYSQLFSAYDNLEQGNQDSTIQLFDFNPNKLTLDEWQKLGLHIGQARVIINYINKGGVFKNKEDLKKIYSINEELYSRLEPFIRLENKTIGNINPEPNVRASKVQLIELNKADSSDLIKIKGIGPVFASRIIKYKNLLGGYISVDQLKEVYGIDSLKYLLIKNQFSECDLSNIRLLNINKDEFKQLLKHPYISYDFTKYIVNRRNKEFFENPEQAFNIEFISDSDFRKLLPYLSTKDQ